MTELSSRTRIVLAATILVPVLLYWGFAGSPSPKSEAHSALSGQIDYFIEGAEVKEWDETGKLQRVMTSTRIEHDPSSSTHKITHPVSNHYRNDGTYSQITAEHGVSLDDNSRTDLAGNVIVNDNPESSTAITLNTEKLSVFPPKDYAETDAAVVIKSRSSKLEGVGMDLNFNARTLNLHSRVEGIHHNAK